MLIVWTAEDGQVKDLQFGESRLASGCEFLSWLEASNRRIVRVECRNEVNATFVRALTNLHETPLLVKGQ